MNKYQNKEIRGKILQILKVNYPDPAGDQLISDMLTDTMYDVTTDDVKVHLSYLEGKGYIKTEKVENKILKMSRTIAILTPEGIDLLEGNIAADAGVEVD